MSTSLEIAVGGGGGFIFMGERMGGRSTAGRMGGRSTACLHTDFGQPVSGTTWNRRQVIGRRWPFLTIGQIARFYATEIIQ